MMKKLGIRYCGGCRAGYDRADFVREIARHLEQQGVAVALDYSPDAAVGLVVCGCSAQCAGREEALPPRWHLVGPDGLFDAVHTAPEAVAEKLAHDFALAGEQA